MSEDAGPTQLEVEAGARYITCSAIMVAEDFFTQVLGPDRLKSINLEGVYVIKLTKPAPVFVFFCGASAAWIPDTPGFAYKWVYQTPPEQMRMATLLGDISNHEFPCRAGLCHIDMKDGGAVVLRRPTDEEIAAIHVKRKAKGSLEKEIAALDKRRLADAGIYPPPERNTPKYLAKLRKIKIEPKQTVTEVTENLFGEEELTEPVEDEEGGPGRKRRRVASKPRPQSHHEELRETLLQLRRKK